MVSSTTELFHQDAYLKTCEARVIEVNERGGVIGAWPQQFFYHATHCRASANCGQRLFREARLALEGIMLAFCPHKGTQKGKAIGNTRYLGQEFG